ncbi:putative arrestin domain protein [Phaeomoniella chlamydospora]|uniref:Putative arrestin domain protein n=1 Tax=Phaeomoniella chlamydospora TaxID=158046 RepID=A0A0G2E685_PHACM|nr:putative arrestin domain protein [Phaeomoniella chlamydospora]
MASDMATHFPTLADDKPVASGSIPPRRTEFKDTETIMNHTWPFFNAQFPLAEHSFMADHVQIAKAPGVTTKELGVTNTSFDLFQQRANSPATRNVNSREAKRLSLQVNQSRSFGKGETPSGGPTVAQKGFKVFHPGDYIYNFELPIDSRLPETIDVDLGNVKYELEASVERSGAFRANLVGSKEVTFIRAPSEGSLEQVEPIAISRNWEDQLHYDIVISGKSFPLGAQVPIAFKLTPLAKVQCHRIKVFVTENIQYFTNNKRVHRLEPTRKVLLFEKRADGRSTSTYPGSSMRVVAGGGVSWDDRARAAAGDEDVRRDENNLLGNLESDSASIGPTEMEFNVQLPSCHAMKDKLKSERITFDTTSQTIQVNHWIKIVMRLSKPDDNDPGKRRHFEISIDSPFHILSCRATQANTALPAYDSSNATPQPTDEYDCGCPGAALRRRNTPPQLPTIAGLTDMAQNNNSSTSVNTLTDQPTVNRSWTNSTAGLARPTPVHLANDPNSGAPRPMHLLRVPSFNPPAFEDDDPPPPMITPPPEYAEIIDGDPRSALADYFSRLADEVGDEDDVVTGRGRVDVPLTPGGRINRSSSLEARICFEAIAEYFQPKIRRNYLWLKRDFEIKVTEGSLAFSSLVRHIRLIAWLEHRILNQGVSRIVTFFDWKYLCLETVESITMPVVIAPIKRGDIPGVVECIQKAFDGDPYSEWVFDQKQVSGILYSFEIIHTSLHAQFLINRVIGVAMWLPPSPASAPQTWTAWYHDYLLWFRQGLQNIRYMGRGGLITKRYWIWKEEQAKIQKELWTDERGYWFCNIVTVLPGEQGKGIGRLLFEDVTRKADVEGTRCYLESSRDKPNVQIYEALGFEVKGKLKVEDGDDACDLFCMIREPKKP